MVTDDENARARNSNLNEDLGKIEYIFSDKTGTLTSNDMQLRFISVKNETYGNAECRYVQWASMKSLKDCQDTSFLQGCIVLCIVLFALHLICK